MDNIELIRQSLEHWYNSTLPHSTHSTIAINYSDEQNLTVKAYHRIKLDVYTITIKNNMSYTKLLYSLTDNYNHCHTTDIEAKESLVQRLLEDLFYYIHQNTL